MLRISETCCQVEGLSAFREEVWRVREETCTVRGQSGGTWSLPWPRVCVTPRRQQIAEDTGRKEKRGVGNGRILREGRRRECGKQVGRITVFPFLRLWRCVRFLHSHSSESPTHTTFLFTKFCRAGDTGYASRHHGHMELSYGLMWVFSGRHILAMPQSTCAGINAVIESQGQSSALSKTTKLITRVGRH